MSDLDFRQKEELLLTRVQQLESENVRLQRDRARLERMLDWWEKRNPDPHAIPPIEVTSPLDGQEFALLPGLTLKALNALKHFVKNMREGYLPGNLELLRAEYAVTCLGRQIERLGERAALAEVRGSLVAQARDQGIPDAMIKEFALNALRESV